MSILSWLKAVTEGGSKAEFIESSPMQFAKGEEMFHGLDMKQALDAHIAWLHRIETRLSGGHTENLDLVRVSGDHDCPLGKWIHDEAHQRFGNLQEYGELRDAHARFHLAVGEALNDIENGDGGRVRERMRTIRHKSGEVQLSLIRLYSKAKH
jgi:methyl-accepting chemotaxis protein